MVPSLLQDKESQTGGRIFFHLWHVKKVFMLFVLYEALSTLFLNLYAVAYVGAPVGKPHVFFTLMPQHTGTKAGRNDPEHGLFFISCPLRDVSIP